MGKNGLAVGVSPAITVAILVFATLILAVALYGYFTSRAATIQAQQQLLDVVYSTSNSVTPTVIVSTTGATRGGLVDNCILVTLTMEDASQGITFFTVLPFDRQGPNTINLYPLIDTVPVTSTCTPGSCTFTVFPYVVGDADGDGSLGLLVDPPPQASSNVMEQQLTCDSAYTYRDYAGVYIEPSFRVEQTLVEPSKIWTAPGEVSFADLGVAHYLPVWRVETSRAPDGSYSITFAFYIRYPQGATDPVNLAILAKVGNDYYIAALYRIPVSG